jgi:hypothetical protein
MTAKNTSRPIDIDRVEAVLLSDGWHHALYRSFDVLDLEFVRANDGGRTEQVQDWGRCFGFSEQDPITGEVRRLAGPIAAILGVRYSRTEDEPDAPDDTFGVE